MRIWSRKRWVINEFMNIKMMHQNRYLEKIPPIIALIGWISYLFTAKKSTQVNCSVSTPTLIDKAGSICSFRFWLCDAFWTNKYLSKPLSVRISNSLSLFPQYSSRFFFQIEWTFCISWISCTYVRKYGMHFKRYQMRQGHLKKRERRAIR